MGYFSPPYPCASYDLVGHNAASQLGPDKKPKSAAGKELEEDGEVKLSQSLRDLVEHSVCFWDPSCPNSGFPQAQLSTIKRTGEKVANSRQKHETIPIWGK